MSNRTESIFSPSILPPDPESVQSRTTSLNFAAAVVAADLMTYVNTELSANGRDPVFILDDSNGSAAKLERQFNRGVFPRVNARLLFDARAFLVDETARLRGAVNRAKV